MEPGSSLPHSQQPTTCPYPEPAQSSPCPPFHFLQIHCNIILWPTPGSPKWFVPWGLAIRILYAPLLCSIRATCPARHMRLLPYETLTGRSFITHISSVDYEVEVAGIVGTATSRWLDSLLIESRWQGEFPCLSRLSLPLTQRPSQWVAALSRE
jgi:hypothetical protein